MILQYGSSLENQRSKPRASGDDPSVLGDIAYSIT